VTTSKTSKTTPQAQDAPQDAPPPSTPLKTRRADEPLVPSEEYLEQLALKLTQWQHFVFQTAHLTEKNRVGIAEVAHEIQVAAYEIRVLMGYELLEAKLGAGMMLTPEEQQVVHNRQAEADRQAEEERRKESIARSTRGLHEQPVKIGDLPQGRRADRKG
jgi:hypothetical protein